MTEKKLLAVYDLSSQPFSIGDILYFVAGATVMASNYQAVAIDYLFISDPSRPPVEPTFEGLLSHNNHMLNAIKFSQIVMLSDKLGNLLFYSSYEDFETYYAENQSRYILWPTLEELTEKKYMVYEICTLLTLYHRTHHSLPHFTIPGEIQKWVFNFFKNNVGPCIPVTVNIRNNKHFHLERNSDIEQLIELFRLTQDMPIKYIIICSLSEIDERFLNFSNVVVAKKFNTTIIQDLALIYYAQIHLGSASGPLTMAMLNCKPYISYNWHHITPHLALYGDSIRFVDNDRVAMSFASPNQHLRFKQQTTETMMCDLSAIMGSINPQNVQVLNDPDCKTIAWLD